MRCAAITRAGERCKLDATSGSYCWSHAPENADARKARGRRGGKARGAVSELAGIKRQLREMVGEVLAEGSRTAAYGVAGQLINLQLRAIEVERKLVEQEQLIARLEALEEAAGEKGARSWGA